MSKQFNRGKNMINNSTEDTYKKHTIHFNGPLNNITVNNIKSTMLQAAKLKAESIDFIFGSDGGDIYSAILLSNFIQSLSIPLKIYNFSNIESAAILVYLSVNERYTTPNGTFVIHSISQYYNSQWYEHFKVKERIAILDRLVEIYIKYYKERTTSAKIPIDIESVLASGAKIINATNSIECGLATEIIHPKEIIMFSEYVSWCVPPQ